MSLELILNCSSLILFKVLECEDIHNTCFHVFGVKYNNPYHAGFTRCLLTIHYLMLPASPRRGGSRPRTSLTLCKTEESFC